MKKCNVFSIIDLVGKKWTFPLLQEIILHGNEGFNFIFRRMKKISPKILSKRLKDLEESGIISRNHVKNSRPAKTEYAVTTKGKELYDIVCLIKKWDIKYDQHTDARCFEKECVVCEKY